MKKLVFLAVVFFGLTAVSFAQTSASSSVHSIVQSPSSPGSAVKIGWVSDLDFGTITNSATGGTVRLDPGTGGLTAIGVGTGDAPSLSSNMGVAASFLVQNGLANRWPVIGYPSTLTSNGVTLSIIGKAEINGVPGTASPAADVVVYQPTATSTDFTVKVGGTLTLPAGATGTYNLTGLTVTVHY